MQLNHVLKTLVDHAKTKPEKNAIHLLNHADVAIIDDKINYHDLLGCVLTLAETIKANTNAGDRVLLCFPTGIEIAIAFYACLWARVIPVLVHVPTNGQLIDKFLAVKKDCGAALTLTDKATLYSLLQPELLTYSDKVISISELRYTPRQACEFTLPSIEPNDIAYLQYTSGSTGDPKGVIIRHKNLRDNITKMSTVFAARDDSIGVCWLPHTHDMGLVGSFLHSVDKGASIYLMSPMSFIRKPFNWLRALSIYRATMTGSPCFGLKICLDNTPDERIHELDLSAMEHIIIGSEMIVPELVDSFMQRLADAKLPPKACAPSYGLAEATVFVSTRAGCHTVDFLNKKTASCGIPHQTVKIVCQETHRECCDQEVGEIWLHGESIAEGYWNKPEYDALFKQKLNNQDPRLFFRTGDLGFMVNNELFLVGRMKDIIIVNGVNYYLQDIEKSVLSSGALLHDATCVAFCWRPDDAHTDQFVVLLRSKKRFSLDDEQKIIISIRKQLLKEYQLIPYDIKIVAFNFPRTTSGKLQRNECCKLYNERYAYAVTE